MTIKIKDVRIETNSICEGGYIVKNLEGNVLQYVNEGYDHWFGFYSKFKPEIFKTIEDVKIALCFIGTTMGNYRTETNYKIFKVEITEQEEN